MLNRFEKVKTLSDLYNVFATEEGVQEYVNLSDEELERIAIVFEANIPEKVDMPDVPLTKAGYNYIWNVVVEEVETNDNEDNEEENENMEDVKMNKMNNQNKNTQEAQDILGAAKNFGKDAMKAGVTFSKDMAKEAKTIAAMSGEQAEEHIKRKFNMNGKKFIKWACDKIGIELKESQFTDDVMGYDEPSEVTTHLQKALADLEAVLNNGEKKGWDKFKDVLKAVFGIIFGIFIEVAKVVLKLAFALGVGTIKVGATVLVTLLSCAGIVKDDVVKPLHKAAKKAHREHKATKAAKAVGVDIILDDDCFEDDAVIE